MAAPLSHCRELIAILDSIFIGRPRVYWEQRFKERGFWFALVNRPSDVATDPRVIANDFLARLDNGLTTIAPPVQIGGPAASLRPGAPELGQHTEEVLTELARCSWDELVALRERWII